MDDSVPDLVPNPIAAITFLQQFAPEGPWPLVAIAATFGFVVQALSKAAAPSAAMVSDLVFCMASLLFCRVKIRWVFRCIAAPGYLGTPALAQSLSSTAFHRR